jgi:hypothetical protein
MWYEMWYGLGGIEIYCLLTGIYFIVRRTLSRHTRAEIAKAQALASEWWERHNN